MNVFVGVAGNIGNKTYLSKGCPKMDKKEWLEKRKEGIGASEAAAVVGLSKYRTPLQVWEAKTNPSLIEQPDNPAMEWGRILEPAIRQHYSDRTGRAVRLPELLRSEKHPFMLATLDGCTDDKRVVEIKTAGSPEGWGEEGTDQVPIHYLLQVQHQLVVTGYLMADIPVLIRGQDFRIYEVPADKELQEMIIEKESAFWEMVKSGTPPPPSNYADVVRLYRQSEAKTVTATEEVEGWTWALRDNRRLQKELVEQEELFKRYLMEEMQEADTLINLRGDVLATWRTGKPTKRLDIRSFENVMPEIFQKFLITGEPVRRFLLKNEKEEKNGSSK